MFLLLLAATSISQMSGTGKHAVMSDDIRAEWFKKKIADTTLTLSCRAAYTDSLARMVNGTKRRDALLLRGRMLYDLGRYEEALRLYDDLAPQIPADSLDLLTYIMWQQAMLAFTVRDYSRSVELSYEMLNAKLPDRLLHYKVNAGAVIADFYKIMNDYAMSRKYIRKNLQLLDHAPTGTHFDEAERDRLKGVFLQQDAELYLLEMMPDSAFQQLQASRKFSSFQHINNRANDLTLMAGISELQGNDEMAEEYYKEALEHKSANYNRTVILVDYMKFLLEKGRAAEARDLAIRYKEVLDKIPGSVMERELCEAMRDYYIAIGDWRSAATNLQRIVDLSDSLSHTTAMMVTHQIAERYEEQGLGDRITSLEKANRSKEVWLIISAIVLAAAACSTFILSRKLGRCKWKEKELIRKIDEQRQKHDDNLRLSAESLETRSQELASMTMLMSRLNEALTKITDACDASDMRPDERLKTIKSVTGELEREENVWKMFRTYFESVNQSFFDRLYRLCPALTNAETRMCAFILLNLTTKETAILTNRSARTVEVIKHNLRKKLRITGPSEAFMRKVASASKSEFEALLTEENSDGSPHP